MKLVKDYSVLNLHPTLIEILEWVDEQFGPGLCTSCYRPGDPKCHGTMPVRAYDRRCRDKGTGDYMAYAINRRWLYDYERPDMRVALCHGKKTHLHIQVHPNTFRIGETG